MTLDPKQNPLLIDRATQSIVAAWWYVNRDTLFSADSHHIVARSISPKTGDRILATWAVPAGSTILMLDQKEGLWVQSATTLTRWSWPKN